MSPGWEHIVVEKGGLKIVSERRDEEGSHSGGRRTGKLDKEAKEKAARVRKMKACWTCWLLKVPVSAASSKTLWCGSICHKLSLIGLMKLILPRSVRNYRLSSDFLGLMSPFHPFAGLRNITGANQLTVFRGRCL